MTDITDRLCNAPAPLSDPDLNDEAADEITRLRAECTAPELRAGIALQLREIERLRAEVADLKERDVFLLSATKDAQAYAIKYADEVMELREQVAALTEDAERYRWLRRKQVALSLPNSTIAALVADQSELDAARKDAP